MRLSQEDYDPRRAHVDVARLGNSLESKIAAYKAAQARVADLSLKRTGEPRGCGEGNDYNPRPSARYGVSINGADGQRAEAALNEAKGAEAAYLRQIEAVVEELNRYHDLSIQYREQVRHNLSVAEDDRAKLDGREPKRHYDDASAGLRSETGDCGRVLDVIRMYLKRGGEATNYGLGSPELERTYAPMAAIERWRHSGRGSNYTQQTISKLETYATKATDRPTSPPRAALGGKHTRDDQDLPAKLTSGGAYAPQLQVKRYAIPLPDVFRRLHSGVNAGSSSAEAYTVGSHGYDA